MSDYTEETVYHLTKWDRDEEARDTCQVQY